LNKTVSPTAACLQLDHLVSGLIKAILNTFVKQLFTALIKLLVHYAKGKSKLIKKFDCLY